tara:strand:+ start:1201 stop:1359 length:159 start_codon:yes stop_codon:yes gene_type:complete
MFFFVVNSITVKIGYFYVVNVSIKLNQNFKILTNMEELGKVKNDNTKNKPPH